MISIIKTIKHRTKRFFQINHAIRIIKLRKIPFYFFNRIHRRIWKTYYQFCTDKVPLDRVNFNIVYGCNLGCDYCSHMSQLDNGFVSLDELKNWYQTWNQKIAPYRVCLLGGEPLLHPQIDEVIIETVKHWNHTRIDILTNGLVLPQKSKTVLNLLKKHAYIYVTKHFDDPDYNEKFDAAIRYMKEYGINFDVFTNYLGWMKVYKIGDNGKLLPFNSNYKKAWDNCNAKNNCLTIMDNELHKCAALSAYYRMAMLKKIPEEWNRVLTYRPLTKNATKTEILKHTTSGAIPECNVCPEKYEFIPTSKISSKFHKSCSVSNIIIFTNNEYQQKQIG